MCVHDSFCKPRTAIRKLTCYSNIFIIYIDLYKLETVSSIKVVYFLRFGRNYWKNMNKLKASSALWRALRSTSPRTSPCPARTSHSGTLRSGHPPCPRNTGKGDPTSSECFRSQLVLRVRRAKLNLNKGWKGLFGGPVNLISFIIFTPAGLQSLYLTKNRSQSLVICLALF